MKQELEVQPHHFDKRRDYISRMVLRIDFFRDTFSDKSVTETTFNTEYMAKEFLMEFNNCAFPVGQLYLFQFQDKPLTQVSKLFCPVIY